MLAFFGGGLIAIAIAFVVNWLIEWALHTGATCKIKFSDFKKWYAVAPDQWDHNWKYNTVGKLGRYKNIGGKLTYCSGIMCYFGPIDYLRFAHWKRQRKDRARHYERYREQERLLLSVQNDIDTVIAQVQKDREDVMNTMKRVAESPNPPSPVEDFLKIWRGIKIH
mgnify:FL=1